MVKLILPARNRVIACCWWWRVITSYLNEKSTTDLHYAFALVQINQKQNDEFETTFNLLCHYEPHYEAFCLIFFE